LNGCKKRGEIKKYIKIIYNFTFHKIIYNMTNPTYAITISSDEIKPEEFEAFVKESSSFSLNRTPVPPKEGRSYSEFILTLTLIDQVSGGVLGNALYDLIKSSFKLLFQSHGAKPNAVIKMQNGNVYNIDGNQPNDKIREQILEHVLEGDIQSIHFDS
jgi:hypothetical protein